MMMENKYVLFPITKGSVYLTIGLVLEEEADKIKVQPLSTPASCWTTIWREIEEPKRPGLEDRWEKAVDCIGRVIKVGMKCLYLDDEDRTIKEGVITEINSELWVTVDEKKKLRNVSIYIND